MADKRIPARYIGDGVYLSFDGYYIWLAVNHHENRVVALEPEHVEQIVQYHKDIQEHYRSK